MLVRILQDSSGIGVFDDPVGFLLGYELGSTLGALLYSETGNPVGIQFIVDIPPGSKVRYLALVVYPLQATLVVPPLGYCPKFLPPPSVTCLTYPLQSTLDVNLSGA